MFMRLPCTVLALLALGCALAIAKPRFPNPAIAKSHFQWPKPDMDEEKNNHKMMLKEANKIDESVEFLEEETDIIGSIATHACTEDVEIGVRGRVEGRTLPSSKYGPIELKNKVIENVTYPLDTCSVTILETSDTTADFEIDVKDVVITVGQEYILPKTDQNAVEGTSKLDVRGSMRFEGVHIASEHKIYVMCCNVKWNQLQLVELTGDLPNSDYTLGVRSIGDASLVTLEQYLCQALAGSYEK